jgi:hypothetical protein
MFKKTRLRIRSTIAGIKAAFQLFVATVEKNTSTIEALAAEQKVLREKFDVLVEHSAFIVRTKKRELERAGHRVD